MPNGELEVTVETRAAVQAQADAMAVLLGVLFQNDVLPGAQVKSVVTHLKDLAAQASGEADPVRQLEGAMLDVIAAHLDDATRDL